MKPSLEQFVAANFEGEAARLIKDWLEPLLDAKDITSALSVNSMLAGAFRGNKFYLAHYAMLQPLFVHAAAAYVEGMSILAEADNPRRNEGIIAMMQLTEPVIAISRFCGKDANDIRVALAKAME